MIKTQNIFPPIPVRDFDWCAYVDGEQDRSDFVAYGKTETEALKSLCEQLFTLYQDK